MIPAPTKKRVAPGICDSCVDIAYDAITLAKLNASKNSVTKVTLKEAGLYNCAECGKELQPGERARAEIGGDIAENGYFEHDIEGYWSNVQHFECPDTE